MQQKILRKDSKGVHQKINYKLSPQNRSLDVMETRRYIDEIIKKTGKEYIGMKQEMDLLSIGKQDLIQIGKQDIRLSNKTEALDSRRGNRSRIHVKQPDCCIGQRKMSPLIKKKRGQGSETEDARSKLTLPKLFNVKVIQPLNKSDIIQQIREERQHRRNRSSVCKNDKVCQKLKISQLQTELTQTFDDESQRYGNYRRGQVMMGQRHLPFHLLQFSRVKTQPLNMYNEEEGDNQPQLCSEYPNAQQIQSRLLEHSQILDPPTSPESGKMKSTNISPWK